MFHMFFLLKYCKSLEEGSFRGRSADFMWMLLLGECPGRGGLDRGWLGGQGRGFMWMLLLGEWQGGAGWQQAHIGRLGRRVAGWTERDSSGEGPSRALPADGPRRGLL